MGTSLCRDLTSICFQWFQQDGIDQCMEEWGGDTLPSQCMEEWGGESRKVYGFMILIVQFCIPLFVSIIVYHKITIYYHNRTKSLLSFTMDMSKKKAVKFRNRRRRFVLFLMLLIFMICWLPINILNLMEDMAMPLNCWPYYFFTFFCFHIFAMTSTCCNPVLYGWTIG